MTTPTMQVWARVWTRSGPACSEAEADARVADILDGEALVDLVVALPVGIDPRDVEEPCAGAT